MGDYCVLCGYKGETHGTTERPNLQVCLTCYIRFCSDTNPERQQQAKGEDEMGWNDVSGSSGGKKDPDVLFIKPNTAKLIHILLPDTEEPVSYWTHYIPNKGSGGPKGHVVICPGRDVCPACAEGKYRTARKHAINVWDYEEKAVKILDGGNTIFQALKQIKDSIGTLGTVDISIKKIVQGGETSYSVVAIPMMSPFDASQLHGLFPIANLRMPHDPQVVRGYIEAMGGKVSTPAPEVQKQIPAPITTPNSPSLSNNVSNSPAGGATFPFGKYKGRTIEDVFREDPNYVKWCAENITDAGIKSACKNIVEKPQTPPPSKSVVSEQTMKQMLINEISEIFQEDTRYKGDYAVVIERMRTASVDAVHPNGTTVLAEFSITQLEQLRDSIK